MTITSRESHDEGRGLRTHLPIPIHQRIPTLDGWRAVAIIAVILSHSRHLIEPGGTFPAATLDAILAWFRLGVDLFFAISGFLITTLIVREQQASGGFSLRQFYTRRVFRILPLVLTYLLILAIAKVWIPAIAQPWEFGSTLLLCRNYFMHRSGGVATNHFWSLSIEEHFYLLWPIILGIWGARRGMVAAVIGAIVVAAWRALDARTGLFRGLVGVDPGALFRTDTRCDALLWGAVAGLVAPRMRDLAARWSGVPWSPLLLAVLVAWIHWDLPVLSSALAVAFPLIVLSTTLRPECATSHLLETGPLRWIGQRSYSMYIWQTLFLQVDQISFSRKAGASPIGAVARYAIDLALIALTSELTHRVIEKPAQKYGKRLALQAQARLGVST